MIVIIYLHNQVRQKDTHKRQYYNLNIVVKTIINLLFKE